MKQKLKISLLSLCASFFFQQNILAQTNPVPSYSHIVVVIGENTKASAVLGSTSAPYITALANAGAKFTNSYALFHPSQPNYIALFSGGNQGVTSDALVTKKFTTANLGKELINVGKTFATFSEDLPSVGYDANTSAKYVRKHNPAANWMGTGTNQIPTTTNQPFTAFPTDFNKLPNVSFVIPNLCNDGHDSCSPLNNRTLQYDSWIQNNLDAYKKWCINNNSLLIVTYDEDDYFASNKIATVFYGANIKVGTYTQKITHYSVLRTIEDANGTTHAGAAATTATIDFCWQTASATATAKVETTPENEKNEVLVFPNPVIGNTLNISGVDNNLNYEILNENRAPFLKGKLTNGTIDVATLPKGIYFLKITLNTNKSLIKRFVKN